jgi:lysophospholipid hydrolase
VAFITISIPRLIYAILSYSFTLTVGNLPSTVRPLTHTLQLNFYTLALLFLCSVIASSVYVRRRYLSKYESLRELPLDKSTAQELHPDVNKSEESASFHNYLDEFLQAIRVFGFLEKPVFHELARHLQTRRLITGDSIALDADKSFYCVVDGNVQIFAPPSGSTGGAIGDDWDDGMSGYQLLNEVGSGGTVSSLFTILSLFTEDVQLRWMEDESLTSTTDIRPPASERLNHRARAGSNTSLDPDRASMRSPPSGLHRSESVVSDESSLSSTGVTVLGHESQTLLAVDPPAQDWDPSGWSPPSVSQPTTPSVNPRNFDSTSRNCSFLEAQ